VFFLTRAGTAVAAAARTARLAEAEDARAQQRLLRRNNPELRWNTARAGVLAWLHGRYHAGSGPGLLAELQTTELAVHEGAPLSSAELERVAAYLNDLHLIELVATGYNIRTEGITCVNLYNGDVTEYLRSQPPTAGPTFNVQHQIVNGAVVVANDVSGPIVASGESLTSFAEMLLRAVPSLPLQPAQQSELRELVTDVQRQTASGSSDDAPRAFRRMVEYLADAGKPVLTAVFALIARHYGLPPE
jgi:hypothetical protein